MNWFPVTFIIANLITTSIHAWLTKDSSDMLFANVFFTHHLTYTTHGIVAPYSIIQQNSETEDTQPIIILKVDILTMTYWNIWILYKLKRLTCYHGDDKIKRCLYNQVMIKYYEHLLNMIYHLLMSCEFEISYLYCI